jgi:hypothetical protein
MKLPVTMTDGILQRQIELWDGNRTTHVPNDLFLSLIVRARAVIQTLAQT